MARPIPYNINLSGVSRFGDSKPPLAEEKEVDKNSERKKGSSNNLILVEPRSSEPAEGTGSTLNVDQHVWFTSGCDGDTELCAIELRLARGPTASAPHTVVPSEPDKPPDKPTNPTEEASTLPEKPTFVPPKPIPHSPKISPSSIPNPSPSVTATKGPEPYPNFGGYLYSIPGYSAFQPIAYPALPGPPPTISPVATQNESSSEFNQLPTQENRRETVIVTKEQEEEQRKEINHTDFEEQFIPEVVPAANEAKPQVKLHTESKLSVASLTQPSIPIPEPESKKKQPERFSLKTSIPIGKIDMKCVNTPPDTTFQTSLTKKISVPSRPAFQISSETNAAQGRVEIQSNVVIKTAAGNETESSTEPIKPSTPMVPNNSISTLINAAEALNSNEQQFWKSKPIEECSIEVNDSFPKQTPAARPIFNPINVETKINFSKKPDAFSEQKNQQIVFIQNNKNPANPKMLVTISQQQSNPQVVLQRASYEPKNMLAPSRLSCLNKKCKDDHDIASSKVVALKRLHQENCDENDFENLITENQIYGNKIVVKEKSQGTLQEQDLKKKETKTVLEKVNHTVDTKSVVIQPNFLYLSNVQFPANLMMFKNNKVGQINEQIKVNNKASGIENKTIEEGSQTKIDDNNATVKSNKTQQVNVVVSKELHVLKSSNNVLQTISNKTSNKTPDLYIHTNQKVLMSPQILYQVPMMVDSDMQNVNTQTFINRDYTKFLSHNKKDAPRAQEQSKGNDKLFIACPYQIDSKLQPKIVITNLRPKLAKVDEVSTLDLYEKRKRLRRLKYLTNRDAKSDTKKVQDRADNPLKNIITPDKMKAEIYKEFANTRVPVLENSSDETDSDGDQNELAEYEALIEKYGSKNEQDNRNKAEFLSVFRLATREVYKEKILDLQERSLQRDSVANAYISAGRIDRLGGGVGTPLSRRLESPTEHFNTCPADLDTGQRLKKKQTFLSQLCLVQVSTQYRDDYEKTWREIVKERRRRNGVAKLATPAPAKLEEPMTIDTKDHLQIMTEITKSVGKNNNLIKRRMDREQTDVTSDSIHALAERNFTELSKLSKMADQSVKLFSGENARKRDPTLVFDSGNVHRIPKPHQHSYPNINIPHISKIISLKSTQEPNIVSTTPATSMDEPQNCAAGLKDETVSSKVARFEETTTENRFRQEPIPWPGLESILNSYRNFEAARKKEIADLQRRSAQLRVDCAYANRTAAKEAECARALLAERQALATEEVNARMSIQRLMTAVEAVRHSS